MSPESHRNFNGIVGALALSTPDRATSAIPAASGSPSTVELHRVLARQLRRAEGKAASAASAAGSPTPAGPLDATSWASFVESINATYHKHDADLELVERSLAIAGEELNERCEQLSHSNAELAERVEVRTLELSHAHAASAERLAELVRLELIVNATDSAVVVTDREGVVEYVNPAFTRISGYEASEILGRKPGQVLQGPNTDRATRAMMRDKLARGEGFETEILNYAKDGRPYWLAIEVRPVFDASRRLTNFMAIERDITAQREAAEQLAEAEARQRQILDTALDAVITMDCLGQITGWNRQAETIFGWSLEEVAGRSLSEIIVPEHQRAAHAGGLARFMETGNARSMNKRLELPAMRRSGEVFPCELAIVPLRRGGSVEFSAFARDVTDRVEAERQLRENDQRFQRIAQNTPGMLFQCVLREGEGLAFTYVSDAVRSIYGVEPEAALADGSLIAGAAHPDEREALARAIERSARELEPFDWSGRIYHVNGSVRHLRVRSRPERLADGGTRWDGLAVDETVQKQAEVELQRAKDRADAALAEAELARVQAEAAQEQAEAASYAKSAFLANMSHEIRTPLSHVISFGELIEGNLRADLHGGQASLPMPLEARHQAAETICRSGKHLLSVLDDVLDLSKIEAGRMTVEAIDVEPARIIEDVASLMRVKAIDKQLVLDVRYASPIPEVITADPTRLRQALLNLVGNALKFTEAGGVLIEAKVDQTLSPKCLFVRVIDSGIGLTDEQRGRLFEPFSQADESTTRRFGGTGLGLAVSRRLVRLMGGELACRSTAGEGSTFTITLPITEQEAHHMTLPNQPPAMPANPSGPLAGLKILVVEDGPENQWLIGMHLRNAGAVVAAAADGQAGVRAVRNSMTDSDPFDCVLMDMQMPIMDGYTASGEVRRMGYPGPVIAFTAHAMTGDREKCLNAGCDAYTTKPINGVELISTISRLVVEKRKLAAA